PSHRCKETPRSCRRHGWLPQCHRPRWWPVSRPVGGRQLRAMVDGAVSTPGVYAHLWAADLAEQLAAGTPQVLVTVLDTRGSAPRDAGARMWVRADTVVDTIGGGHLEWKAMAVARD